MTPTEITVNQLLNNLDEEDYGKAVSYIQFLSESRRRSNARKATEVLDEIQSILDGDTGWESEEEMFADMAQYRREHLGL